MTNKDEILAMRIAWVLVTITLGMVLFLGACPGRTMHAHLMLGHATPASP